MPPLETSASAIGAGHHQASALGGGRRQAIDSLTEVPVDLFEALVQAGRRARHRGQHRLVDNGRGFRRLRLSEHLYPSHRNQVLEPVRVPQAKVTEISLFDRAEAERQASKSRSSGETSSRKVMGEIGNRKVSDSLYKRGEEHMARSAGKVSPRPSTSAGHSTTLGRGAAGRLPRVAPVNEPPTLLTSRAITAPSKSSSTTSSLQTCSKAASSIDFMDAASSAAMRAKRVSRISMLTGRQSMSASGGSSAFCNSMACDPLSNCFWSKA